MDSATRSRQSYYTALMKRPGSSIVGGTTIKKTDTVYLTATEGLPSQLSSPDKSPSKGRIFKTINNAALRNMNKSSRNASSVSGSVDIGVIRAMTVSRNSSRPSTGLMMMEHQLRMEQRSNKSSYRKAQSAIPPLQQSNSNSYKVANERDVSSSSSKIPRVAFGKCFSSKDNSSMNSLKSSKRQVRSQDKTQDDCLVIEQNKFSEIYPDSEMQEAVV